MSTAKKPLVFDTLASVKKLEEAGVPQKQAEAHIRLFSEIVEESICSKQDLLETEGRLEIKLKELEVKLKETEGRIDLKLKELEFKIEEVRKEMAYQIEQAKNNLIKWFIGTSLVSLGLIMGIVTSAVKLVH